MELTEFARTILCSADLDEKLFVPDSFTDTTPKHNFVLPSLPGRPVSLSMSNPIAKQKTPKLSTLESDRNRAILMHFFANHELMAMELMALALLKFPDAPEKFRIGIAHTIVEEQRHFQLYRKRIESLGVGFGEVGVNAFFWNALSEMASPMDYVTQMSMTFEQANLDYALFYGTFFEKLGDYESASIMEEIFRDEIGHLAHGVKWFNQWKEPEKDIWTAYKESLSFPLSPSWAKGFGFTEQGRLDAGLSIHFIRQLKVYSKSKGRPPRLFLFNPQTALPGFFGSSEQLNQQELLEFRKDLESIMLFLAIKTDVIISEKPALLFLETLQSCGIELPEFVAPSDVEDMFEERRHFQSFCPWNWNQEGLSLYQKLSPKIVEKEELFVTDLLPDKLLSEALEHSEGVCLYTEDEALFSDLEYRLSFLTHVGSKKVKLRLTHAFSPPKKGIKGYVLGKKLTGLTPEAMQFLHRRTPDTSSVIKQMEDLSLKLQDAWRETGFCGPLSIEFLVRRVQGVFEWSIVAAQPHFSLGHVATELEDMMHPGRSGVWVLFDLKNLSSFATNEPDSFCQALKDSFPLETVDHIGRTSIKSGAFFTNDPTSCRRWLSVLIVGRNIEILQEQLLSL